MTQIDDIKTRLDIIDVVSGYVPELKKMGRSWKARCPFHSERTPSFVVDPERQTWHCFGSCSTGGDVIEFVRRIEGLDFKEALHLCAERAGVELRAPSQREVAEREVHERLLAANEAAAIYFQAALAGPDGADARAYCESRGLDQATIETWQLGYAPEGWSGLIDHLVTRGFTQADLVEAGLAIEGDRGAYDRFRGRLMFPTRDARRRLIGFGARAMRPGDEPKYLNTPQTPLFEKSANLYGLDRANDAIRRQDRAVVVEGYMDVIGAHQFGFENVVASNGTAITEKQMELLKRYTHNVVLALDADSAGSAATVRGVEVAARSGDRADLALIGHGGGANFIRTISTFDGEIRVAVLPKGEDPDSLVRKDTEQFATLLATAKPFLDFLFEASVPDCASEPVAVRQKVVDGFLPTLRAIGSEIARATYVQKLARATGVDERLIMRMMGAPVASELAGGDRPQPRPVVTPAEVKAAKKATAVPRDGETQLLEVIVQRHESRGTALGLDPGLFEDSLNRLVFAAWLADADLAEHLAELDDDTRERYQALRAAPLPQYEPRQVGDMVTAMARELRTRRQAARLLAVAREQAEVMRAARQTDGDGAPVAVVGEAADEFTETVQRQKALAREYQVATGRRTRTDDDPRDGSVA